MLTGLEKTVIVRVLPNYPARLHCMHFTALVFVLFWIRKLLNEGAEMSRGGRFEEKKK